MDRHILLIMPLFFLGGCLYDPEHCRYPNLFQPGHISKQQHWANQFDPFTSSEMGPKIEGDRPSGVLDPTPASQRWQKR